MPNDPEATNILFLHHSTGKMIWDAGVEKWLMEYNNRYGTNFNIIEQEFPKKSPYGWNNYPFDYWNIWEEGLGSDV